MLAFRPFAITHLNTIVFYISLLVPTNRERKTWLASRPPPTLLLLRRSLSAQTRSVCHWGRLITFDNALCTFTSHLTSASNFVIPFTPKTPTWSTPQGFQNNILYVHYTIPHACYTPTHLILLDVITVYENALLSLKVPRLRPLVLLIRTVLIWWWCVWSIGGMLLTGENRSTERKICASGTLSITNVTRIGLHLNPDLGSERPASDWPPEPRQGLWNLRFNQKTNKFIPHREHKPSPVQRLFAATVTRTQTRQTHSSRMFNQAVGSNSTVTASVRWGPASSGTSRSDCGTWFTVLSEQPIGHILKEASTPLKGNRWVVPKRRYTTTNIIKNPVQPRPHPYHGGNPKSRTDVSCSDELPIHHHDWSVSQPPYNPNWIKLAENAVSPSIWAKSQDESLLSCQTDRQADCSNTR